MNKKDLSIPDDIERLLTLLNIPPCSKMVEFGCCDLRPVSFCLINYFNKYIGCDINDNFLNKAKEKTIGLNNCEILKENIESSSFDDDSFDVIICNNMLSYTDKIKSLREINRILKTNGFVISLNNNTIDYSIDKIINYKLNKKAVTNSFFIESTYSICTIINTLLYRCTSLKITTTTFNTGGELDRLFRSMINFDYCISSNINGRIKVINFILKKREENGVRTDLFSLKN